MDLSLNIYVMKSCNTCNIIKDDDEFYGWNKSKCRSCMGYLP